MSATVSRMDMKKRKILERVFMENFEHFKQENLNKSQVVDYLSKIVDFPITTANIDSMLKAEIIPRWYTEKIVKKVVEVPDDRIEAVEKKLGELEAKLATKPDASGNAVSDKRVESLEQRIVAIEQKVTATISQLLRLEKCNETVSKQVVQLFGTVNALQAATACLET